MNLCASSKKIPRIPLHFVSMVRQIEEKTIFLVNSLPPYRIPLFNLLALKFKHITFFYDKKLESDRQWTFNSSGIKFKYKKISSFSIPKWGKAGAGRDFHVPVFLPIQILLMQPKIIVATEIGLRTLAAVLYKIFFPSTRIYLWLTLSERTESRYGNLRRMYRQFVLARSNKIIVAGQSAKRYISTFPNHSYVQVSAQAIKILGNENFTNSETNSEQPKFLIVSSIEPRKNVFWAVKSLQNWLQQNEIYANLTIIGDYSPDLTKLDCRNLKIHYAGFVEYADTAKYYLNSDLLIFPTLLDEWGLVVNESLNFSTPVLGSVFAESVNELIVDNFNGWSFNPESEVSFSSALDSFLNTFHNTIEFLKIKENAKKSILENASLEKLALAFTPHEGEHRTDVSTVPSIVMSLRYLNTYRVPLIESLSKIIIQHNLTLNTLGALPNHRQRKLQDASWHSTYKVLPEFRLNLFNKEIRFRWFPKKYLYCPILITEHASGNIHNYFLLMLRKFLGKKTALIGHGSNITSNQWLFSKTLDNFQIKLSDWYFAYTDNSRERALQNGCNESKITVFNNSTDTNKLHDYLEQIPLNQEPKIQWTALYIGALTSEKNIAELLELSARVNRKYPNFKLILCGAGNFDRKDQLGYEVSCTFAGYKTGIELAKIARNAQIIITLGRIGLIATDSFALELPIFGITSKNLHGPEFEYLNQSNSRIFHDIDGLENGIEDGLNDNLLIRELKKGCKESYLGYSTEQSAAQIFAGINSMIKQT